MNQNKAFFGKPFNLKSFSTREKQGKIEDGQLRVQREIELQNQQIKDLRDRKREFLILNLAKVR